MQQRVRSNSDLRCEVKRTSSLPMLATLIGAVIASNAGTPAAAQVTDDTMSEEIIVTAQKREENLQDVPISVSVLSGETLDRSSLEGVTEALTLVPGAKITVGNQGGGTQVSLRGVAAGGPLFNGSSTVGYYIDSVPFGFVKTAAIPDSNIYDLERIEVLRGPQGTLYGASALNGVIRLITNEADLNEYEFKARTTASLTEGGQASYRGDAALNVPLIEGRLGARLVLGYNDLGGWIDRPSDDESNGGDLMNARLRINAAVTNNLSVGLLGWISRSEFDAPPIGNADYTTPARAEPYTTDYDVFGAQVDYDLQSFTVSSRTSYIDFANEGVLDFQPLFGIASFLTSNLYSSVFSQEILLNSAQNDTWLWSAGGYYRDAKDRLYQDLPGVGLEAPIDFSDTSESFAVFGEVTHIFDGGRFELTGGLRYFEDEVTQSENIRHCVGSCPGTPLFRATETFDALSPRLVLTWHPGEDLTFYASYSEGFRSGFNQNANVIQSAPSFPPLDADTLSNYEIGAKGALLNGRLRFDTALYYIDWQDVQQTVGVEVAPAVYATGLVNGESASGLGIDAALTYEITDNLNVALSTSWNDLAMDADVFSNGILFFSGGERLNFSSEQTFGAQAEYIFDMGGGYQGRLTGSGNYSSAQTTRSMSGTAVTIAESDDILMTRASFAVEAPEHWSLTVFVDNTNEEDGTPAANTLTSAWDTRLRPRTFGLQFDYRY